MELTKKEDIQVSELVRESPEEILNQLWTFFNDTDVYKFIRNYVWNYQLTRGMHVLAIGKGDTADNDLRKLYRDQGRRVGASLIYALEQEVKRERERRISKRDAELEPSGGAAATNTK